MWGSEEATFSSARADFYARRRPEAAVAILLTGKISEKENIFMRVARGHYEPSLRAALAARGVVVSTAIALVILCLLIASRMLGSR
ncbi:MAG TPA: hypothetical protein VIS96_15645 [Terrimicrobiaceae bacterium]